MKFLSILALTSAALAAPAAIPAPAPVPAEETTPNPEYVSRQVLPTTEEGLRLGLTCGDVVLIFARGSTEVGNMGSIIGPDLARALGRRLGTRDLTVQGVNYAALLSTNYLPGGTDLISENEMKSMLRLADTKCPNAQIVVSGYRYEYSSLCLLVLSPRTISRRARSLTYLL
jgi:cutinase